MKKIKHILMALTAVLLLCQCTGSDEYTNAMPKDAIALVSIDVQQMASQGSGKVVGLFKQLLLTENLSECGIDGRQPAYLFEDAQGTLGVCAAVTDDDRLSRWIDEKMVKEGRAQTMPDRKDCRFAITTDGWMVGYSDCALLVVGPLVQTQRPTMQQQVAKWLTQDEEHGVKASKLYQRMEEMEAPIRMVAQAQALPAELAAPLTIGAPKEAAPSQVMVAAEIQPHEQVVEMTAQTFSWNEKIQQDITEAEKRLQPIDDRFLNMIPRHAQMAMVAHVPGEPFLDMLKANQGTQMLLTGANTAIDMDKIIRSVDGQVVVAVSGSQQSMTGLTMLAQLKNTDFLADVDYWKTSAPKGTTIADEGPQAFSYNDAHGKLLFGVAGGNTFYATANGEVVAGEPLPQQEQMPQEVLSKMKGQSLAAIFHITALKEKASDIQLMANLLQTLFGKAEYVVMTKKQ